MNPRQHEGFIYEAMFKVEALKRMFDVLEPSTVQPYDVIVECPRGLVKVQVKGSNLAGHGDSMRFKVNDNRRVTNYTKLFDVMACYLQPYDCWYLIPSATITTGSLRLFPKTKTKISKRERYKENWSLFYEQ